MIDPDGRRNGRYVPGIIVTDNDTAGILQPRRGQASDGHPTGAHRRDTHAAQDEDYIVRIELAYTVDGPTKLRMSVFRRAGN